MFHSPTQTPHDLAPSRAVKPAASVPPSGERSKAAGAASRQTSRKSSDRKDQTSLGAEGSLAAITPTARPSPRTGAPEPQSESKTIAPGRQSFIGRDNHLGYGRWAIPEHRR